MKKIDRNKFFSLFDPSRDCIDRDGCITKIAPEAVIEFKHGSKYYYKLIEDSYFKETHNNLCDKLLNSIELNNSAVAYRSGISYFNLFEPHLSGYYFLRLDISSFFHSIQEDLLRKCFSSYFENEYIDNNEKQTLLDGFIALTTYEIPSVSPNERFKDKVVLPIGFKTSPVISNIVFRKLDIIIKKYCVSRNITYTRYADDMLFSSPVMYRYLHSEAFMNEIRYFLSIDGFKINKRKTIKTEHTISLNGYILSNESHGTKAAFLRISNKKTNLIKKLLYKLDAGESNQAIMTTLFGFRNTTKHFKYSPPKQEYLDKYCKDQIYNKIAGYRSYLISIIKFNEKYQCVNDSAIEKYANLVELLNKRL